MPSEKCWYLCEGNAIHVLGAEETKFFCDLLPFQHCVTSLRGTAWSPQPLQIKPGLIFLLWAPLYVSKRNVQRRWFCNKGEDLEQPGTVKVTSSMSLPTQTQHPVMVPWPFHRGCFPSLSPVPRVTPALLPSHPQTAAGLVGNLPSQEDTTRIKQCLRS